VIQGGGDMMFETHPTIFMFLEFIGLGLLLFSLVVIPIIQTSYQNERKRKIKCLRLSLIFLSVLTIGNLILGFLPFVEETQIVKNYSTPSFTVSGKDETVIVTARETNRQKKDKFVFNENLEFIKEYDYDHLIDRLYIHWDLLTKCNFDCSYSDYSSPDCFECSNSDC